MIKAIVRFEMGNRKRGKLIQKVKESLKRPIMENQITTEESTSGTEGEEDCAIRLTMRKIDWSPNNAGLNSISYNHIFKVFELAAPAGIVSVLKQKDGLLAIRAKNRRAADAVMKIKSIQGHKVEVAEEQAPRLSKGVAYHTDFRWMTEDEIVEAFLRDKVIQVTKMKRKVVGQIIGPINYTGLIFLTFDAMKPPEQIKLGYLEVNVEKFVPSPLRCFNCLAFGHTKTRCRQQAATCGNCGDDDHISRDDRACGMTCDRPKRCANCNSTAHNTFSKLCIKFKIEQEVIDIKTSSNVSYPEARRILASRQRQQSTRMKVQCECPCFCGKTSKKVSVREAKSFEPMPSTSKRARRNAIDSPPTKFNIFLQNSDSDG